MSDKLQESASYIRLKMMADDPLTVLILSRGPFVHRNEVVRESVQDSRVTLVPGFKVTPRTGLHDVLRFGWNHVEEWGVWSEDSRSIIVFKIPAWLALPVQLDLQVAAFLDRSGHQTASVYLRNRFLKSVEFVDELPRKVSCLIEEHDRSDDLCVDLVISVKAPVSPSEVGRGDDHRKIGLALMQIELLSGLPADADAS